MAAPAFLACSATNQFPAAATGAGILLIEGNPAGRNLALAML